MNSADFLDAVRERHGLPSDNQAAKLLGIPPARISMYRTGARQFSDETAQTVAAALDADPGYVMAEIAAERAKRSDVKDAWRRLAELARHASPAVAWVSVTGFILATGAREGAQAALGILRQIGGGVGFALRRRLLTRPEPLRGAA